MKNELNIFAQKGNSINEIQLFREFQRLLLKKYKCTFIDETHQQYVNFISTKCFKKRELSDLMIITYSKKLKHSRLTFLQAKFEKKQFINGKFNFKGDYYQYILLSERPIIQNASSKFKFPDDILSNAILESIGSFGIFYYDDQNRIDFAYSTASDLKTSNFNINCRTKARQIYFNNFPNNFGIIKQTNGLQELRQTLYADCFEKALINLNVGSPIIDKKMIRYFKLFLNSIRNENDVIEDFINYLNSIDESEPEENVNFEYKLFTNILLLNVDTKD